MAKDGAMMRQWVKEFTERMVKEGEDEYNKDHSGNNADAMNNSNNNSENGRVIVKKGKFKNLAEARESRFLATENWVSIVPATFGWDSREGIQVVPNVTEATYAGGGIGLFKMFKSAFFSSSSSSSAIKLCYDEIFPLWINRLVRVANRVLSKKYVRMIENVDRAAAGMDEIADDEE